MADSSLAANDHDDPWYLELPEAQGSDPFTPEQLSALLVQGKITLETRITSERLRGAWITVSELLRPRPEPVIPPRPDEKTLNPAPGGERSSFEAREADSVDRLFEIVQSVRERKPGASAQKQQPKDLPKDFSAPETAAFGRALSRLVWTLAPVSAAGLLAIWAVMATLSSRKEAAAVHPEPAFKAPHVALQPRAIAHAQTVAITPPAPAAPAEGRALERPTFGRRAFGRQPIHPLPIAQAADRANLDQDRDADQDADPADDSRDSIDRPGRLDNRMGRMGRPGMDRMNRMDRSLASAPPDGQGSAADSPDADDSDGASTGAPDPLTEVSHAAPDSGQQDGDASSSTPEHHQEGDATQYNDSGASSGDPDDPSRSASTPAY